MRCDALCATQVFVALLRTCQPDGRRVLVRQALDTLTPALVRRLAPGDAKHPIWVRYTKKVLVEEGHSMPHLIHIWQLIVRHADLFYSSRHALLAFLHSTSFGCDGSWVLLHFAEGACLCGIASHVCNSLRTTIAVHRCSQILLQTLKQLRPVRRV